MTAADIAYVDHDPLIPTHLGTDAPHVHVRTTDRCLRRPEGVECLSPAELRAEVERLRAEVERLRAEVEEAEANEGVAVAEAEAAEAERDALQQRLDNGLTWAQNARNHGVATGGLFAALGGPAAPPRWDEETDALFVDAARRAAPPQEPQPTPESQMPAPCATDGSCSWPSCICGADLDDEPVERITDANGDETERGADTDTENTHQQGGGV